MQQSPTPAQMDRAAFKVIVGEGKYTSTGSPVETIYDVSMGAGVGEIKNRISILDLLYQVRLQVFGLLVNNAPYNIYTNRTINSSFNTWLTRWGVTVKSLPK